MENEDSEPYLPAMEQRMGKTEGDPDTIVFKDGRFRSSACDRHGYGDGPYTTSAAAGSTAR